MIEAINLAEKFDQFDEHWSPKIAGELNGQYVKLAKFEGEFVWHQHEAEDELFLVIRGELLIQLRAGEVRIHQGEFAIVPRGGEHRPVAEQEAHVLLFEPRSTVNTGELQSERTRSDEWV